MADAFIRDLPTDVCRDCGMNVGRGGFNVNRVGADSIPEMGDDFHDSWGSDKLIERYGPDIENAVMSGEVDTSWLCTLCDAEIYVESHPGGPGDVMGRFGDDHPSRPGEVLYYDDEEWDRYYEGRDQMRDASVAAAMAGQYAIDEFNLRLQDWPHLAEPWTHPGKESEYAGEVSEPILPMGQDIRISGLEDLRGAMGLPTRQLSEDDDFRASTDVFETAWGVAKWKPPTHSDLPEGIANEIARHRRGCRQDPYTSFGEDCACCGDQGGHHGGCLDCLMGPEWGMANNPQDWQRPNNPTRDPVYADPPYATSSDEEVAPSIDLEPQGQLGTCCESFTAEVGKIVSGTPYDPENEWLDSPHSDQAVREGRLAHQTDFPNVLSTWLDQDCDQVMEYLQNVVIDDLQQIMSGDYTFDEIKPIARPILDDLQEAIENYDACERGEFIPSEGDMPFGMGGGVHDDIMIASKDTFEDAWNVAKDEEDASDPMHYLGRPITNTSEAKAYIYQMMEDGKYDHHWDDSAEDCLRNYPLFIRGLAQKRQDEMWNIADPWDLMEEMGHDYATDWPNPPGKEGSKHNWRNYP